jgi:hypothetical protein
MVQSQLDYALPVKYTWSCEIFIFLLTSQKLIIPLSLSLLFYLFFHSSIDILIVILQSTSLNHYYFVMLYNSVRTYGIRYIYLLLLFQVSGKKICESVGLKKLEELN